jgi:hypothetical protein
MRINQMGMYDTIDDIAAYCPKCGNMVNNSWQTNDLNSCLDHYKPGDELPYNRAHEYWVEIHTICESCDLFISLKLNITATMITNEIC